MIRTLPRILLVICFFTLALSLYDNRDLIDKINLANFNSTQSGVWLIVLYKHTCPHCVKFEPQMEKAALGLKGIVKIGAFDCVSEKPPGLKSSPVPRLVLVVEGKVKAIRQEDSTEGVVRFVLSNLKKVKLQ